MITFKDMMEELRRDLIALDENDYRNSQEYRTVMERIEEKYGMNMRTLRRLYYTWITSGVGGPNEIC